MAAVAAIVAALPTLVVNTSSLSATTTTTFHAVADSFVEKLSPATNNGSLTYIQLDGTPINRGYVRFDVSSLTGTISKATLRLYSMDSNLKGFEVAGVASNAWGENTITWNNAPAPGASIGSSGPVSSGQWYGVDVTPLVPGYGSVTFALPATGTSAARYASRQAGANGPQLVVETGTSTTTTTAPSGDPVLMAAGDIACPTTASNYNGGNGVASACRMKATSDLLLQVDPDVVATLGDNQYDSGALAQFNASYDPTWGRKKSLTRPTPGNHEYQSDPDAGGYYAYFGAAAGTPTKGYYSYDLGTWHVVVLNANCSRVGGCGAGSPQEVWLRADLAAHPAACTLAYWHQPRWSSGTHGNNTFVDAFWKALYDAGADVVLNGHDHHYERFAPQNPAGQADGSRGIREFVVGTGGGSLYAISAVKPNSEKRNAGTFGALGLTLHAGSYDWKFHPEAGKTFTDSGTASCH